MGSRGVEKWKGVHYYIGCAWGGRGDMRLYVCVWWKDERIVERGNDLREWCCCDWLRGLNAEGKKSERVGESEREKSRRRDDAKTDIERQDMNGGTVGVG